MKTYIGIDNGVTGALACLDPEENWTFQPVAVIDCGKDRLLDLAGNLAFIQAAVERAGGPANLVVVYERQKKNPLFGARGNFANGRNDEFWRVSLTLTGIAFCCVDPNTWQHDVLKGIAGTDTKQMAKLYVEQRYPTVKLDTLYNAAKQEAIRDAMCIASWARSNCK